MLLKCAGLADAVISNPAPAFRINSARQSHLWARLILHEVSLLRHAMRLEEYGLNTGRQERWIL